MKRISLSQIIPKCQKTKKIGGFSAIAAVPPPLFHILTLYHLNTTAIQNFSAVTLFLVEFLLLFKKCHIRPLPFFQ